MNTHSESQINWDTRVRLEPIIQNNPQPSLFNPPNGGDQNCIATLEAHIKDLTQQNTELLHRRPRQPHPEMNRDEHEEEQSNNHTDGHSLREEDHREHNHQEDNFHEVNCCEF
jgi:hypothetical protein